MKLFSSIIEIPELITNRYPLQRTGTAKNHPPALYIINYIKSLINMPFAAR